MIGVRPDKGPWDILRLAGEAPDSTLWVGIIPWTGYRFIIMCEESMRVL